MFRPSAAKLSFNLVPAGNHPTNVSLHSRTKGRIMIHFVGKLMRHTGLASPSQAHTSPSLPGQPEAQTRSTTAQVPSCDKLSQAISGPRYSNPQALHCVTSIATVPQAVLVEGGLSQMHVRIGLTPTPTAAAPACRTTSRARRYSVPLQPTQICRISSCNNNQPGSSGVRHARP